MTRSSGKDGDEALDAGGPMLVNDLSVADARHLLRCEGGELTLRDFAIQGTSIAITFGLLARAIASGGATVWHMLLPMVAQYLTLIAAMPIVYAFAPHPALRKDVVGSLRLWGIVTLAAAIAVGVRAWRSGGELSELATADLRAAWDWIVDAKMALPMLSAAVSMVESLRARVRKLYEFGPPFVGVSLGCAMRLVVPLLGCFLLPLVVSSAGRLAWTIFAMMLAAEILALAMHWDLQRRLRKLDADKS